MVAEVRAAGATVPQPITMTRIVDGLPTEVPNRRHPGRGFRASEEDVQEMAADVRRLENDYA